MSDRSAAAAPGTRSTPGTARAAGDGPSGLRFDAVLFDLDGTLIDSAPAVRLAWERWAEQEGVSKADLAPLTGRPARDIVGALVEPDRAEASLALYTSLAEQTAEGVTALPGAVDALAATAGRSMIVTSSSRAVATARIAASALRVPVLVTAEDVRRGKPDGEPYLRGAAALRVDPRRCLAVEDTAAGVASGRAAGCWTLGLSHGIDDPALLAAHFTAHDLGELRFEVDGEGPGVITLSAVAH